MNIELLLLIALLFGFPLSILFIWIYLRLKGKKTERDYKQSQQFKNRRDEFIQKIGEKKEKKDD